MDSSSNSFLRFILGVVKSLFVVPFTIFEHLFWLIFPRKSKSLKDEVILITGAAHGIGREICKELVRKSDSKAKLVCWDINKQGLDTLIQELRKNGVQAFPFVVDISDTHQVAQAAEMTREAVGSVTMLINNAGIMPFIKLLDHKPEDIAKLYDINVLAHFWIIKQFLPDMIKKRSGHIVAISSASALVAVPNLVAYSGTKFAVRGYMQGLEEEMFYHPSKPDIKFTTVYPSHTVTSNDLKPVQAMCKYPFLRGSLVSQPNDVAKTVVDGIRKNYCHIYIPKGTAGCYLYGVLPHKLRKYVFRSIGQDVDDGCIV